MSKIKKFLKQAVSIIAMTAMLLDSSAVTTLAAEVGDVIEVDGDASVSEEPQVFEEETVWEDEVISDAARRELGLVYPDETVYNGG